MSYVSGLNRQRAHVFETTVTELQQDLQLPAVRQRLGIAATDELSAITSRLELAQVKNGVISLGRRAITDGKVAVAMLSPDETKTHHIAPTLRWSMLPEQRAHFNMLALPLQERLVFSPRMRQLRDAALLRLGPHERLDCGNVLFDSLCPSDEAITLHRGLYAYQSPNTLYQVLFRPSIVMRLPTNKYPKLSAYTLLHESRHVLQTCLPPITVKTRDDLVEQSFRSEVEACHQHVSYLEAIGIDITQLPYANHAYIERIRRELTIPILGQDEPFGKYETLRQQLDDGFMADEVAESDFRMHNLSICCVRSLAAAYKRKWLRQLGITSADTQETNQPQA